MPILKGKRAIAGALNVARKSRKYAEGGHTEEHPHEEGHHRSDPLSLKQVRAQIAKTGEIPDIDSLPRGLVDTVIASILHGAKTGFVAPAHALASKEPIPTEHMLSPSRDMAAIAVGAARAAAVAKEIKKNLATYTSETLGPKVRETALPDDQIAPEPADSFAEGGETDLPDVGEPLVPSGGEFSQGTRLGNKAADIGSKLGSGILTGPPQAAYGIMKNMVQGSKDAMQDYGGAEDGHIVNPQSIQGAGDLIHEGVNSTAGVRPVSGVAGVFVGPYGAARLRNEARETGNVAAERALVHPVVGKEIEADVNAMPHDLRDPYRSQVQDARDQWALSELNARAAKGDFYDRDIFAKSGWSFTADGKPAKEISDLGASVKNHGNNTYSFEHPAGDLHKVYDIPPIRQDPQAAALDAKAFVRYSPTPNGKFEIGVGKDPTKAVNSVLHEVEHGIALREGWPTGSTLKDVPQAVIDREHFPAQALPKYQREAMEKAEPKLKKAFAAKEPESSEYYAKVMGYLHSAGENQSFNTATRRNQSYLYQKHPADTEMVGRVFQDVKPFYKEHATTRPRDEVLEHIREHNQRDYNTKQSWDETRRLLKEQKMRGDPPFAGGGSVGNFNPERGAAFGLAKQGMIKSDVPGRTDKLNLNVPSGSYIIPADIPSALGQGNSMAGGTILDKMFNKGPYGMNLGRAKAGSRVGPRKASLMKMKGFAEGGDTGEATPIVAAGGEYTVHPETVAGLGNGDIELGHSILDSFVKQVRAKHISTLRGLKPPKGS